MSKPISPKVFARPEHTVSRSQLSENALKVLLRLKHEGFAAQLVGGCVRDLLLEREPKDFDVVTDAKPEQIRKIFHNARLIGRRFRLAHIRFGREIIEVATYRANPEQQDDRREFTESGRILSDNIYGNQQEDALRRDFTVNALYYDIADFSITDYVSGVEDIQRGVIRIIGNATQRFREDPVRMLRAVRFAAKLGFRIEPETEAPIAQLAPLLRDVPAARMFEEVLKLFHGGNALGTFESLRHYGLFEHIFPLTEQALAQEYNGFPHTLIPAALGNTDARINGGKSVTPAFLFAVMLWHPLVFEAERLQHQGSSRHEAYRLAASWVLQQQAQHTSVPRRFSTPMREIWSMQGRFARRGGRQAMRLLDHPRFRAAYDFMCLRARSGEETDELCDWWTRFQEVDEDQARAMVRELGDGAKRRKSPRRRKAASRVKH